MTDTAPPTRQPEDGTSKERLMALEIGLRHFQQICEIRQSQIVKEIEAIQRHNHQQDEHLAVMEEKQMGRIEAIYRLLWSGMRWLGGLLATMLLMIILNGLKLI